MTRLRSDKQFLQGDNDVYFNLAVQILARINTSQSAEDTIPDILSMIKNVTGFEAVGIRLKSGYDYPYYVTQGFPEFFVEAERYLCAYDQHGEPLRDSKGNPYLECMCGNVLCGRTDPSLPFFTPFGSFWSNCTTDLLKNTSEKERQARTRNRCNGEGYESVALIPLHGKNETIGLLQLNDTRKNMFTAHMISKLEGIGHAIGVSFVQKQINDRVATINHNQEERVRELNVLYSLSSLMEKYFEDYEAVLKQTVNIIPLSFVPSMGVHARIHYKFKIFSSDINTETPFRIERNLIINNDELGKFILFFSDVDEKNIKQKENLINLIFSHITRFLESYEADQKLKNHHIELNELIDSKTRELQKINKKLHKALNEKEVLIKEIHHRIKNNLNIVQSLLNLQSFKIKDNEARAVIDESQSRIQAISLIHDMLHKNSFINTVNIREYITEIAKKLQQSFHTLTKELAITVDMPDVHMNIDTVIPCGIIINELLINAIKYAFPQDRSGIITVTLKDAGDKKYTIKVHDNGIGLPESIDPHNPQTFGMEIINALVRQLEGSIKINRKKGTSFSFTFKDIEFSGNEQ